MRLALLPHISRSWRFAPSCSAYSSAPSTRSATETVPSIGSARSSDTVEVSQLEERHPLVDEIIRVDLAGELAAKHIYLSQLAAHRGTEEGRQQLQEMLEHELEHLRYFEEAIPRARARPSVLNPLWQGLASALGTVSALAGEKASFLTTAAVEEVIVEHYSSQIEALDKEIAAGNQSPELERYLNELRQRVTKFRDEEDHHRQTGEDHGGSDLTPLDSLARWT
eukprot:CAMPEP_0174238242 /NCGR_PEP_ID=MMETSP0417-20130205/10658_1 /TAXON_ID=242541 /ORGANISM="Mayorella sp, Strain BSH-02190019" /LENGTH=223 /DNA_ID=CAMNT_0015317059 /DNA_START=62 /DNA_END=730 /DNA_ORIENTATION=+